MYENEKKQKKDRRKGWREGGKRLRVVGCYDVGGGGDGDGDYTDVYKRKKNKKG